jgi:TonB family protein
MGAPQISTNPLAHNRPSSTGSNQARDARLKQFEQLVNDLQQGRSSVTTIEIGSAPAGKEDAYAQFVKDTYTAKWDLAEADSRGNDAVTKVTVTIGSDGKVLSSSIIGSSGDAQVDQTVQRTLDRVAFIRPFGEGARETQRTYTINFSLRSKRS